MYNRFQLVSRYLNYYLTASNGKGHGTHSPFIFHFITRVLNDKTIYPEYAKVEALRSGLLADKTILSVEDFGAGSGISKSNQRTVASIAKNAAKPRKLGQLLFRMVREYKPATIVELGTSLGITSSYLALGNTAASLVTIEGATTIAAKAAQNFQELGVDNIKLVTGNFDNTLPSVISELASIDFAFVDGNHREEPTVRYFNELLPKIHNNTILVFDDIHWSREMENAWATIQQHPSVKCTIDLFFIGIVVFRKEFHEKQHFRIRF